MSTREIRTKIKSIQGTQKITRAMELVAASKMRTAQGRMSRSRPYAEKIRQAISHVAKSHSEYRHPYLMKREDTQRVGFIVVSSDRGLCGGLNVNLFKTVLHNVKEWSDKNTPVDFCLIGQKAESFFARIKTNVIAQAKHLGDDPAITDLIGLVKAMLTAYDKGELDAIYLGYNEFVNTMVQRPKVEQLLPLEISDDEAKDSGYWDYIYEPDAKELLDVLLVRYIESQVYQAVVENLACEQAARMVAMKSATDNASELIDELNLAYNKMRQAAITQEISEIVGGAAAV